MFAAIDRLRTLKVSDVMAKNVVEVSKNQTMEEVAKQFTSNDISSAPVINEQGRCVVMLSAADYLKRDPPRHEHGETPVAMQGHSLVRDESRDSLGIVAARDTVDCYMASAVQSIAADASLLEAGRVMCAAHVHRIPVLDGERVVGIVSTMDIVAAMLNAVDELDADRPMDF